MFWYDKILIFLLHVFFRQSMQISSSAPLHCLHLYTEYLWNWIQSACLVNIHFCKCALQCWSFKHVLCLLFFGYFCLYGYILRDCVPFVHRHAGSGRPTSAPWRLLAWQRFRSSMIASTHMLHAPMSSGTIRLWWYVAVEIWCWHALCKYF